MFYLIKKLFGINKVNLIGWVFLIMILQICWLIITLCALICSTHEHLPFIMALAAIGLLLLGLFAVGSQKLIIMYIEKIEQESKSAQK